MGRRTPARNSSRQSLRAELERLGVSEGAAAPLAEQLVQLASELSEAEYRALVEGVVLGTRAGSTADPRDSFHNILEDFTSELKKLDEGLKLLTAYLGRLRERVVEDEPARTLH